MSKLSEIEGIGDVYSARLSDSGVASLEDLLKKCCAKKDRKEFAEKTDISEKLILNWVNRADLSRIKGISTQYADLLECSGVDTVPELAQRNPENLLEKMTHSNEEKSLVRKLPTNSQVQDWVSQAKELPRIVNY